VESDRRTATAFLRLIALSIPVAAVVLYFGVAGRPAAVSVPPEPPPPVKRPAAETPAMPVPAPESAAPKVAASEPADRLAVQLSATRPCWISVTVDGEKTVERILQPGEQQALDVHREMVLVAGDAAALAVTLNGALAKPLGRAGEVVTTRLTLNNFKEYLASP
jgi:hypothetical protein